MGSPLTELMGLINWRSGIPIACFWATALAFLSYADASRQKLKHATLRGLLGLLFAYGFVWILLGGQMILDSEWWRRKISFSFALMCAMGTGLFIGFLFVAQTRKISDFFIGCVPTYLMLVVFIVSLSTSGKTFFFVIHSVLCLLFSLGPVFSFAFAVYLIFQESDRPWPIFALFFYIEFCSTVVLINFLALRIRHYLLPIPFLFGPFLIFGLLFINFKRLAMRTIGVLVLFISTLVQTTTGVFPIYDEIQSLARTLNPVWLTIAYIFIACGLSIFYLFKLAQGWDDGAVENLNLPLLNAGVVLNAGLVYIVVANGGQWIWTVRFAILSAMIGMILVFGRRIALLRGKKHLKLTTLE